MKNFSSLDPSRKGFVTNYPPFRHWKKIAADEMRDREPIVIYVHIPFCIQRCAYCYFKTAPLKKMVRRLDRYVSALCREIEIAARYFDLKERPVASIYFGGGTPTLMKEDQLRRITETLHNHLNIDTPEFAMEAEPVTLTRKKADVMKKIGVNRISLGVQSFRADILKLCDRLDNEEKVMKALGIARDTGAVVNIDLLSGLAGETRETWAYSIGRALETEVQSITVYKMELHANTEYYRRIRRGEIELPSDDLELEFMQYALDQFGQARYLPWGFFTYTKNGQYPCRYASNLWQGTDCYAFGASGVGVLGNWLFQNTNGEEKYVDILEGGRLPVNRGYRLTSMDQMIRSVMLGMKLTRFDLKKFQEKHGLALEILCGPALRKLETDGFISVSEDEITMTPKGILYGDHIGKILGQSLIKMAKGL